MSESSSNQPRFCTNCGSEKRPGEQFCVNCGANLSPNQESTESGSVSSGPSLSNRFGSMMDSMGVAFSKLGSRLSGASSSPSGNTWRGTPGRLLSRFQDLPSTPTVIIVGLLAVVLLILLSPIVQLVIIITLGVSVIALVLQGIRRRSIREWGIVAVGSLVLIPIFGGLSAIVYDSGIPLSGIASLERSSVPLFASSGDWNSEEDYVADMEDSLQRIGTIEGSVADELYAYEYDDYTFEDDVAAEIAGARTDLESHIDYFENTTPPAGYAQYQEEMLASWEDFDASLEVLYEAFYYGESSSYSEGLDMVTDFYDAAEAAEEELPDTEEAQELKNLEILTGIGLQESL